MRRAEGSSLYSPLAVVIMGGLVSSTLLARLGTPLMCKLLAPVVEVASPDGAEPDVPGASWRHPGCGVMLASATGEQGRLLR